jgi:hypothetical protein
MDRIVGEVTEIEFHPYKYQQRGWLFSRYIIEGSYRPLKTFGTCPWYTSWRSSALLRAFINNPTQSLQPKLGISLCSLAIYKFTPLPATPNPLCTLNGVFHTKASFVTKYFFALCIGC